MSAFRAVFVFELRYHLRSAVFWMAALAFALMAFGAVTTDVIIVGGAVGNVNRNAPFVITQILAVLSLVGVFVTTAFVAGAVLRDHDLRTHELFFATPLGKSAYLGGRFLGALVAALLVFVPVALAIMIGSLMPWLEPERIGPFMLSPYLAAYAVFVVPNLLLMSAVFFGLATLTRSLMGTYVGVVAFFAAYAVAGTLLDDLENQRLAALLDPFGFGALNLMTRYWTTFERNTLVVGLDGPLLANRLLWTGIGLLVLGLTWARFRFTVAETGRARRRRRTAEAVAAPPAAPSAVAAPRSAAIAPATGAGAALAQYLRQTRLEVGRVVHALPFLIILAFGVLNLIGTSLVLDELYGTPVHPVTHLMLTTIQSGYLLFVGIIVTIYAGEMVWRDRQTGIADVVDATPVPGWVLWASKATALTVVVYATLAVGIVTAAGIQLWRGYTALEPVLYAKGVFLEIGVPFVQVALLALFVQALVQHKFVGYLAMIAFFISAPVLAALDLDHRLYHYAQSPPAPYSDMNGYGHFVQPLFWYGLYWSFAAALLVVAVHLLWVRGRETGLRTRLALARARFRGPVRAAAALCVLGIALTGGWIFYNTTVLNEYVPPGVQRERQARYEREYKRFEDTPQPRITAVYAEVDLYPERRDAEIRGRYTLENRHDAPIDSLHVLLSTDVTVRRLDVPGTAVHEDAELGYRIYRLAERLAPGAVIELPFELAVETRGFTNDAGNTNLVRNGTFFNNYDYFPHIGYTRVFELQDPNHRRRHDLPPVQRMPPLEDEAARANNYISTQADWIDFETIVSTAPDQTALAPGYLQREWLDDGRRYFHYRMDAPILGFFAYLSGEWQVARDAWNDVAIEVYHHPAHTYNVQRMIDAVKASLDYFTTAFSPYQHRQVRIVEFPRYAQFAQAFPNTIPFSESIGFIARLDDDDDAIDYVYYVTAHEVAHQWWAHQVIGAHQQGATVMSETMAQYSALMVMEQEYGPLLMRRFLEYELESYLRGRGGERIEELPLLRVENQPYIHYNKGSLVMYRLRDLFGEGPLNAALSRYIGRVAFQQPPYTTSLEFLDALREAQPDTVAGVLEDLFETITLWDVRALAASWTARDDGRYDVRLEVETRKYRADGAGVETEVPIGDWIEVAVFGERADGEPPEGRVLFLERRWIDSPASVIDVTVDAEPRRAGIDPFNRLIDRNPGNNTTAVAAPGRAGRGAPASGR